PWGDQEEPHGRGGAAVPGLTGVSYPCRLGGRHGAVVEGVTAVVLHEQPGQHGDDEHDPTHDHVGGAETDQVVGGAEQPGEDHDAHLLRHVEPDHVGRGGDPHVEHPGDVLH